MSNTIGNIYRLTAFGESHGPAVGGVIDGVPAGIPLDVADIQRQLDRRRPGQSDIVTGRDEKDRVHLLSGIFEGKTTGAPIGFMVENAAQRSGDYDNLRDIYRPSHADYTYAVKYGIRDHRGGGRSSARTTISAVVGGAVAAHILDRAGVRVCAYTRSVGDIDMAPVAGVPAHEDIEANAVRCPDAAAAVRMEELIRHVKSNGDTVGGIVECVITGVGPGLGEPVFDKLSARLAAAMMSINAAKGVEFGMGFEGTRHRGSEMADVWEPCADDPRGVRTLSNNSGGIQGGISNGEPIVLRVAFKPVATLLMPQTTVDKDGNRVSVAVRGRHDPCVVPRAVPVVEAMAAMVILDAMLLNNARI